MKEIRGDLFSEKADAICITTNGFTKANGECVMGKGCAKQLATRYPVVPKILGDLIRQNGNITQILNSHHTGTKVVAFPVKPISKIYTHSSNVVSHMRDKFRRGDTIPGWACTADIHIIIESANQLVELANKYNWTKVVLPRPGCGAGELDWEYVKTVLDTILDDRFYSITY